MKNLGPLTRRIPTVGTEQTHTPGAIQHVPLSSTFPANRQLAPEIEVDTATFLLIYNIFK